MKKIFEVGIGFLAVYGAGMIAGQVITGYLDEHEKAFADAIVDKLLTEIKENEEVDLYFDNQKVVTRTYKRVDIFSFKDAPKKKTSSLKEKIRGLKKIIKTANVAVETLGKEEE